ncbi:MAG: ABC transporter permease [Dehalococcoidia bacterium]|nr:ABC transporter permease [Dehalococcoidia bacterium]
MWRYALRRLLFLPLIVVLVAVFTFVLLRVLPGQDPARVMAGQGATPDQIKEIHRQLGLDYPVFPVSLRGEPPFVQLNRHDQFSKWLGAALRGDFGVTYQSQAPVRQEFARRFPASFELILLALIIGSVFGISFGILSALYRNSVLDYVVRVFAVFGASVPEFFLLTLLIILPSYLFNYAPPIGGYHSLLREPMLNLRQFGPPALILGIGGSAALMRLVRTTMLEVLRADYIRTAQAKGLSRPTIVLTHAFRNAATPIVTALGTAFLAVFGGSVIAETIMSIQGVGAFFFISTLSRDLPVIQFLAVYTAVVVVLANLIIDLSYALIDRRVRYS